jgi:hypothetical protein
MELYLDQQDPVIVSLNQRYNHICARIGEAYTSLRAIQKNIRDLIRERADISAQHSFYLANKTPAAKEEVVG